MLNENQINAVEHIDGPCLTLAGPGSGKTTVLVERIINLILKGVDPNQILVITFTKDAANEMKNRFLNKIAPKSYNVTFGTFHSVFYNILKNSGKYRGFTLMHDNMKKGILDECIKLSGIKEFGKDEIEGLVKEISYYCNTGGELSDESVSVLSPDEFSLFFDIYTKRKALHKLIDFDDMLVLTRDLLSEDETLRRYWQEKFSYFLVDELQDINGVQFDVLKLLIRNHPCGSENIFGVGDDDQSIYGFRGANPGFMLSFPEVFKGTKMILLDKNYRSNYEIVNKGRALIENNTERFFKDYSAFSDKPGIIKVIKYEDEFEQARAIYNLISSENARGKLEDTAILYRNRKRATYLYNLLKKGNVEVFSDENVMSLKDSFVAKDFISYLRIIIGDYKRSDILRVMNKPSRGLSRGGLNHEKTSLSEWLKFYPQGSDGYERVFKFNNSIEIMRGFSPFMAINYIKRGLGYDEYLKLNSKELGDYDGLIEKSNELLAYAAEFKDVKSLLKDLLSNEDHKISKRGKEKVCFFTFHGSKGLEFKRVFIIDCVEGITPSKNAKDIKLLEEERRMFYVAMTRAKEELYLSVPKKIQEEDVYPSRFLSEMENDL